MLTGHSLGGSVSNIVAARFALKSVSFSPPGIYYGHLKFGIKSVDSIDQQVFRCVPRSGKRRGEDTRLVNPSLRSMPSLRV